MQILPLKLSHIWTLDTLPYYHKDPFDRLLISQAITENLIILGVDSVFDSYLIPYKKYGKKCRLFSFYYRLQNF